MSQQDSFAQIEQHREAIDAIDKQLVALLNERAGHSLDIRALKPEAKMGLFDPKREEEIFTKVCSYNDFFFNDTATTEIYTAILKVMKEVPNRD